MRTALVTGAGRRIGAEIAGGLAADGWRVLLHYNKSVAEAEAVADGIRARGGTCALVQADLSRTEEMEALVPGCIARHGPIDCLVNNASSFRNDGIGTLSRESFEGQWVPNLMAPLILARDFSRAYAGTEGCIVNLLDQKVFSLNPDFFSYTISKVALEAATRMLAMALAPRIRVCGVAPGITLISGKQSEESFQRAWRAPPLGRSSTPEDVAAAVRFILATPSMTGQVITIDGGESLQRRARDVAFDLP